MLVKTFSSCIQGVDAFIITIEVDITQGTGYVMVGLPDNAVRESLFRIESALRNNKLSMPRTRIVINLAPADLRKEGSAFDLGVAVGILAASGQLSMEMAAKYLLMGELSLDGRLKRIKGALAIAVEAQKKGYKGLILPKENTGEAAIVKGLDVYGADSITEVADFLRGKISLEKSVLNPREEFSRHQKKSSIDFSDVKGQENIKRALEIAAAGGHNAILIGPPGAGKTMLARRLPSILPLLSLRETLETTKIHSVAGKLPSGSSLIFERPFRSPHHTVSDVALVGGGNIPQPGEISLAHNGVLFLDELPEFKRSVLEVMRQPMEERKVNVSRARFSVDYPASFMLLASMNPCPCGFHNHPERECVCPPGMVQKYLNKISGPLMDRIDLHVEVTPVSISEISSMRASEKSDVVRKRVEAAREIQNTRFDDSDGVYCNAQMTARMVRDICRLDTAGINLLKKAMEKLGLSARAYDRILKVSRTIADLAQSKEIRIEHLAEAIQYRSLDRNSWSS